MQNVIVLKDGWTDVLEAENKKLGEVTAQDLTLDNLAYVVYSSGTTGKPKGIQMSVGIILYWAGQ